MTSNEIPFRSEQRTVFDYDDLEKLIEDIYGQDLDILEIYAELMGNYSFREFDVFPGRIPGSLPEGLDEWNDEAAEALVFEWAKSGGDIDDELVIWHLMYTGKLPQGKYLMKLEW